LEIVEAVFTGWMFFLSPSQQCQSTEASERREMFFLFIKPLKLHSYDVIYYTESFGNEKPCYNRITAVTVSCLSPSLLLMIGELVKFNMFAKSESLHCIKVFVKPTLMCCLFT